MTKAQEEIRKYLLHVTKGVINLKPEYLKEITRIAITVKDPEYLAILFRKNYQQDTWEKVRTVDITEETLQAVLKKYGATGVNGFYRWDIYGKNDEFIRNIYSVSSNLF